MIHLELQSYLYFGMQAFLKLSLFNETIGLKTLRVCQCFGENHKKIVAAAIEAAPRLWFFLALSKNH